MLNEAGWPLLKWDESNHPRDGSGRFATKVSASAVRGLLRSGERLMFRGGDRKWSFRGVSDLGGVYVTPHRRISNRYAKERGGGGELENENPQVRAYALDTSRIVDLSDKTQFRAYRAWATRRYFKGKKKVGDEGAADLAMREFMWRGDHAGPDLRRWLSTRGKVGIFDPGKSKIYSDRVVWHRQPQAFILDPSVLRELGHVRVKKSGDGGIVALRKADFLDVERAAAATNATPTAAQVAAGNYKKGAVKLHGLTIRIENPAGSVRHGIGRDGKPWSATMPAHYGYISGTKGFDGDEVDVWIGPVPDLAHVYVINQLRLGTDRFDEHKVGMGFHHESDFLSVYRMAYPNLNADDLIHDVVRMPVWRLKRWLASGRPAKQMAKMAEVSSGRYLKSRLAAMYCKAHGRDLALFGPYIGVDGRRRVVVQDKETKRKWSVAYAKVKLEALTGKPLEPGFEADHKNKDRTNDAARNLVALDSYENKVKHGKYRRSLLKWDDGKHPRGEGGKFTAGQRSMAARGVPAGVVSKYPGVRVSSAGRAKTGQVGLFGGATDADAFYAPGMKSAKHAEHAGGTWSRNEALIALAHRNVKTPVRGGGIFVISRNLPSLGGKRPSSAQIKSLAIHEFGHLVDAKSRGGKNRFSAHPDFLRAYARDAVAATAHDERLYDKVMADIPKGTFSGKNDGALLRILRSMKIGYWKTHPQEAFAEAFRTITDRRFASSEMSDHIRDRRFVAASMPNVVRVARKLLLRKDFSGVERAAAQTNTIPTLAKAKQRLTAEDVATLSEGRIARMIERTMSWVRDDVIDDIIAGLKAGADPAEVAREVAAGEGLSEKLNSAADALEAVYAQAGQEAADQSGGKSRKLVAFQFDARNPKSATYFDEYRLWLVREMSAEQEATIQTIAREGILSGKSLDAVARDLRVTVGLTAYQARNVMNYRRELEDLEPAAMLRALRDRRYDSTIRRAIESGDALTPEQITKMVEAYHRRYVAYRSVTIARTEGLRAANMGVMASAYQAINDGVVQPQDVVKRWIAKIDDKTRDSHAELNGQQIRGVDSPFRASSGALLAFPGDPSAPAAETINCRCSLAFTMLPSNS